MILLLLLFVVSTGDYRSTDILQFLSYALDKDGFALGTALNNVKFSFKKSNCKLLKDSMWNGSNYEQSNYKQSIGSKF